MQQRRERCARQLGLGYEPARTALGDEAPEVSLIAARRQNDEGPAAVRSELRGDREAIGVRQLYVEQHEIRV